MHRVLDLRAPLVLASVVTVVTVVIHKQVLWHLLTVELALHMVPPEFQTVGELLVVPVAVLAEADRERLRLVTRQVEEAEEVTLEAEEEMATKVPATSPPYRPVEEEVADLTKLAPRRPLA